MRRAAAQQPPARAERLGNALSADFLTAVLLPAVRGNASLWLLGVDYAARHESAHAHVRARREAAGLDLEELGLELPTGWSDDSDKSDSSDDDADMADLVSEDAKARAFRCLRLLLASVVLVRDTCTAAVAHSAAATSAADAVRSEPQARGASARRVNVCLHGKWW